MFKAIFHLLKASKFAKIVLALVYIISPVDLIPEAVFGAVGFIDDGAAAIYLLKTLATDSAGRFIMPRLLRGLKGAVGVLLILFAAFVVLIIVRNR
ncbi:MAG: DUF1232 domain-containing protein [Treponema sp.]|nr:DUF1232 domain-containing protein [Treponema sp.]